MDLSLSPAVILFEEESGPANIHQTTTIRSTDIMSKEKLKEYRKRRNFDQTAKPFGKDKDDSDSQIFVIQKHKASRLHYDFRIEADGTLKSWAVPKGPSTDPSV